MKLPMLENTLPLLYIIPTQIEKKKKKKKLKLKYSHPTSIQHQI